MDAACEASPPFFGRRLQAASERQDRYGHRFGDGSYTPEMVVDGSVGLMGPDRDKVNEPSR
jgi:hypothetical protein